MIYFRQFLLGGFKVNFHTVIRIHFLHRHVRDTVIIVEEGNLPHPWCARCYMLVLWAALNGHHPNTSQCVKGAENNRCRLAAEEMWESNERSLRAYVRPLTSLSSFKYLGRIIGASDNEWPAVVSNL